MSALTDALDRIQTWLQLNYSSATSFAHPLTYIQIKEMTKELPFKLPREVYELYQWHNGTPVNQGLFPFQKFFPLEEAMNFVIKSRQAKVPIYPYGLIIFGGFKYDRSFYYIPGDEKDKETSPIWCSPMGEECEFFYPSLTHLMLMIAECYETGAYYVKSEKNLYLEEDENKSKLIFCKYNPGWDFDTIHKFFEP